MFYRTYRPQTVSELDTPEIRDRLTAILKSDPLPHAFIFAGPKGIGKTSIARIIAKAINCEKNKFSGEGDSIEPCNKCQTCKSITAGQAVDVIELDGASNRRIDDVRALNTSVSLSAVYTSYKVYIIDEVHMLTNEAFNALLKTLEEPPSHVIFILATTELDKLPPTIISRCMLVQFTKASPEDIVHMLERVIKKEKVKAEPGTLEYIADHSDGAFRDAAKILEEASLTSKEITVEIVKQILGMDQGAQSLLDLIVKKDVKALFSFLEDYQNQGKSSKVLIETVLHTLHDLLLSKQSGKESTISLDLSSKQIFLLMKEFQQAYKDIKYTPIPTLPIEIAVIEYLAKRK
ncbi:MAG: DNA polymerase III subunit gamma/tau [Candidatus Roizmanbacteria bacterium]